MYIPEYYKANDPALAIELIEQNPFGLLLCNHASLPLVTHVPFIVEKKEDGFKLYTHIARVNPQAKVLNNNKVLAVFTGPHAYISASWYHNTRNVPTWNYAAVHISCEAKEITNNTKVLELLQQTVAHFESGDIAHHLSVPDEYKNALSKEICFYELEVLNVETKCKFNQNKPKEDILNVIAKLENRGNQNDQAVADMMRKFNTEKLK